MIKQVYLDLLEEMITFPKVYNLTDYGLETVKDLYETLKKLKSNC